MASALRRAVASLPPPPEGLAPERVDAWTVSVTHREVLEASSSSSSSSGDSSEGVGPNGSCRVMARTLEGLREEAEASAALGPGGDPEKKESFLASLYYTPPEDVPLLERLRAESLALATDSRRLLEARHPWPGGRGLDTAASPSDMAYARDLTARLHEALTSAVAEAGAAARAAAPDAVEAEAAAHWATAEAKAASFVGRGDHLLAEVVAAMAGHPSSTTTPSVMFGESGSGKTSLLATAAISLAGSGSASAGSSAQPQPQPQPLGLGRDQVTDQARCSGTTPLAESSGHPPSDPSDPSSAPTQTPPRPVTIIRFCGHTPLSTTARGLLASLAAQIERAYRGPSSETLGALPGGRSQSQAWVQPVPPPQRPRRRRRSMRAGLRSRG